jgi:hypothetical protein
MAATALSISTKLGASADRERDLFRRIAVFSGDGLERRRVGDLLTLIWFDDVARRAVLLGLTFAIVGAAASVLWAAKITTPSPTSSG